MSDSESGFPGPGSLGLPANWDEIPDDAPVAMSKGFITFMLATLTRQTAKIIQLDREAEHHCAAINELMIRAKGAEIGQEVDHFLQQVAAAATEEEPEEGEEKNGEQ